MVAYSFQKRFCKAIERGEKCQTIRAERKRHARVGERLQLFYGMRTKHCRKLIADPVCVSTQRIEIQFTGGTILSIAIAGTAIPQAHFDRFAQEDGFQDAEDMASFWVAAHGDKPFTGVLIKWEDEDEIETIGSFTINVGRCYGKSKEAA